MMDLYALLRRSIIIGFFASSFPLQSKKSLECIREEKNAICQECARTVESVREDKTMILCMDNQLT